MKFFELVFSVVVVIVYVFIFLLSIFLLYNYSLNFLKCIFLNEAQCAGTTLLGGVAFFSVIASLCFFIITIALDVYLICVKKTERVYYFAILFGSFFVWFILQNGQTPPFLLARTVYNLLLMILLFKYLKSGIKLFSTDKK